MPYRVWSSACGGFHAARLDSHCTPLKLTKLSGSLLTAHRAHCSLLTGIPISGDANRDSGSPREGFGIRDHDPPG